MERILTVSWGYVVNDRIPKAPKWATGYPLITESRTMFINGQELAFWQKNEEPKIVAVWTRNMP